MRLVTSESVVFVVDDDGAVRDSLTLLLKLSGYAVEAYDSATRFLAEAKPSTRDCLIADIRMPEMDGLELQQELIRRQSALPVIVVTGHGDIPLAVQAMKAGAVDFLEKPFAREVMLAAVRRALERKTQSAVSDVAQDEIGRRLAQLTEREREVYDRVVAGKQSKVIAHELGTSPRTIEIHRARMMQKMQARNLQDLVRMAIAARTLSGS
jgi:two-component system, LuxR family, response regulator FixJ